jgi:pimeloyl-ACP methyl ester carboxylesterase
LLLRHPGKKIGVIGESLGSGPACTLARMSVAPRKIVLIAPFDRLVNVAADHMPLLPVSLLLRDRWDNVEALKNYTGPIEIYAGRRDRTIRVEHAERLAAAVGARMTVLNAGHNDWASTGMVRIE